MPNYSQQTHTQHNWNLFTFVLWTHKCKLTSFTLFNLNINNLDRIKHVSRYCFVEKQNKELLRVNMIHISARDCKCNSNFLYPHSNNNTTHSYTQQKRCIQLIFFYKISRITVIFCQKACRLRSAAFGCQPRWDASQAPAKTERALSRSYARYCTQLAGILEWF